jgi:hypothetical protein
MVGLSAESKGWRGPKKGEHHLLVAVPNTQCLFIVLGLPEEVNPGTRTAREKILGAF